MHLTREGYREYARVSDVHVSYSCWNSVGPVQSDLSGPDPGCDRRKQNQSSEETSTCKKTTLRVEGRLWKEGRD